MKAFILAAGLGTRLKPWTLEHPKALVPVAGIPMLQRVIDSLSRQGAHRLVVNIHHFGEQIIDFLSSDPDYQEIRISDERERLLDTGGALLKAAPLIKGLNPDEKVCIIHNVDILSNADIKSLYDYHLSSGNDITLLTSDRASSRQLIFNNDDILTGWHNRSTGEYRPASYRPDSSHAEAAFSGIYVVSDTVFETLREYSEFIHSDAFPVMDFLLDPKNPLRIGRHHHPCLQLIDIGKPDTLKMADELFVKEDIGHPSK